VAGNTFLALCVHTTAWRLDWSSELGKEGRMLDVVVAVAVAWGLALKIIAPTPAVAEDETFLIMYVVRTPLSL
jgi:hypothetical protein